MPDFISTALENFWNGQGKGIVQTYVMLAISFIVLHLHLNGMISAATMQGWGLMIVAAIGGLLSNVLHHNTLNSNVAPAPGGADAAGATLSPNAATPSATQSQPPPGNS